MDVEEAANEAYLPQREKAVHGHWESNNESSPAFSPMTLWKVDMVSMWSS